MTIENNTCEEEKQNEEDNSEQTPLNSVNVSNTEVKRSCGAQCRYVMANVTVEPTMVLFVLSCILMMLTTQNLSLEKACRVNLNYSDEICQSLKLQQIGSQNEYERETQKLLAKFIASKTYITATVPCLLSLLAGSWSDKTGRRKAFLLIPMIGQILCCISNMINTYFLNELSLEVLIFSEAILEALSGSWCLAFFTIFAYISTITSEETRTFRMGLINFSMTVGFPIGMGLSGVILKNYGYYGCYGLALCLHIINFSYTAIFLKDPPRTLEQKEVIIYNSVIGYLTAFFL